MKMAYRVSSFNAAIDLEDDDFLAINDAESFNAIRYDDCPKDLEQKLSALPGISQIEFNGHFGASIFFTIDATDADAADPFAIADVIKAHVKECRKFLKKHGMERKIIVNG